MPSTPENKASTKGMKRESGHPSSVSGIEYSRAGEKGRNEGQVFKIPQDHPEVCNVRTPEHK